MKFNSHFKTANTNRKHKKTNKEKKLSVIDSA